MSQVDQVRAAADIVKIVGDYVKLRKSGANYVGLCPFHQEKTPSFAVHPVKQIFHCFGCGKGGDVFKFVMVMDGLPFPEALRRVAEKVGVHLEERAGEETYDANTKLRAALMKLHEIAAKFFASQLGATAEGRMARAYLADRGMTDEVVGRFRIGYAPGDGQGLVRQLAGSDFEKEALEKSGLIIYDAERAASLRSFPAAHYLSHRQRRGEGGGVRGPGAGRRPAQVSELARNGDLHQKPVALSPGPRRAGHPQARLRHFGGRLYGLHRGGLERHRKRGGFLRHQPDGGADSAARPLHAARGGKLRPGLRRAWRRRSARWRCCWKRDLKPKCWRCPAGLDPDEFVRKQGAKAYGELLANAPSYLDYLTERAAKTHDLRTPEGKVAAANAILPYLIKVPNPMLRAELAGRLAERLRVDERLLRDELRRAAGEKRGEVRVTEEATATPTTPSSNCCAPAWKMKRLRRPCCRKFWKAACWVG